MRITPSGPRSGLGEIALLVLDHRKLAGAVDHRRTGRQPFGEPLPDAIRGHPPARLEHLVDEAFAAHRPDRGQQARGKPVVRGGEEVLGVFGHVVHVARPADTVADRFAANEVRGLEGTQLLEHAGPARTERRGEVIG